VLAFLLLNAAAAAVALVVVRAVAWPARTSLALLTGLSGYLLVVHTAMLAAGLAGALTIGGVALVLAMAGLGAGAATWVVGRGHARANAAGDKDGVRFTAAELFAPVGALAAGVLWAWPHVFEATRLWVWDDYTYHMVYPALWLRDGAIAAPPPGQAFTMQAWYPLSASVVASWFMLPFPGSRGDALAWVSLTGLLYGAIVATAMAELLARLGCRRGAWAVPVVLLLTSHRIAIMASSFSDADLAQAATLFATLVFSIPRGREETRRDILVDAGLAALLSGLAIGVKVSAVPVAVIVALAVALRSGRRQAAVGIALVFAGAWAITGAYWYARNWWHTGNPLYPAAFLLWPGATFPQTTLREYAAHYGVARTVRDALAVYGNWPAAHAALAAAGLVGMAGWLAVRRAGAGPARDFAAAALVVSAVVLIALPSAPYSAGNGMTFVSGFIHWDSMRYVALLPLLGWAALGALLDAGAGAPRGRTAVAIAVTAGAVSMGGLPARHAAVMLGVIGVVAMLAARVPVALDRRAAVASAVAVAAILVVTGHGRKAAATAAAIHGEPLFGPAAVVLDRQPPGTRVALFGDQWTYPALGDRGHLRPIRLDANGRLASAATGAAMTPGPLAVDAATFAANLRAAGVGLVVIVHMPHPGRSPAWPTQRAGLGAVDGARRIHEDRGVSVWRLDSPAK
jgi:hypothetical protein